jgi:hypothetical protein
MAVLFASEVPNQFGAMASVGLGPALLLMEANGGLGSRLCVNSNDRAPVYKFQSIFGRFPPFTSSAKRKSSLQMRRFQTISEFSHSLNP